MTAAVFLGENAANKSGRGKFLSAFIFAAAGGEKAMSEDAFAPVPYAPISSGSRTQSGSRLILMAGSRYGGAVSLRRNGAKEKETASWRLHVNF